MGAPDFSHTPFMTRLQTVANPIFPLGITTELSFSPSDAVATSALTQTTFPRHRGRIGEFTLRLSKWEGQKELVGIKGCHFIHRLPIMFQTYIFHVVIA